jgi:hypothetical protein
VCRRFEPNVSIYQVEPAVQEQVTHTCLDVGLRTAMLRRD